MSWDRVKKNWKAVKAAVEATLSTLSPNDFDAINNDREQFEGKLPGLYGFDKEQIRKEADRWAQEAIDQRVLRDRKPDKDKTD